MTAFMAERCRRSPLLAAIAYASRFVALGLLSSSLGAQSQSPPPSALINQRLGDTLERARALIDAADGGAVRFRGEMIEDLLPVAFNQAHAKTKALHQEAMQSVTGSICSH